MVDDKLRSPTDPVDPEVQQEFEEASVAGRAGARHLRDKQDRHHEETPQITAGDVDAAWDRSDIGEESPGGTVATPDQDIVEEIGEAVGLTFQDNEEVDTPGKMARRDRDRWELNPASSEDYGNRKKQR
jgi:hypothetical protein